MAKYRYARANGEQLPSRFIEQVQSSVDAFFTTLQAYDLRKDFVSGSDVNAPSFIANRELPGYLGKNLVGWYRLGDAFTSTATIKDSSGNGHEMVPRDNAGTFVMGNTPSTYVARGAITFDDANSEGYKTEGEAPGEAFSFGNETGTRDKPFSVAFWFKPSATPDFILDYVIGKGTYSSDAEWFIRYHHTNTDLRLELRDQSAGAAKAQGRSATGVFPQGSWHHVVVTYDGRGGTDAAHGMVMYHNGSAISVSKSTSASYKGMVTDSSEPFTIGSSDGYAHAAADIAEVAVWGKVLTGAEVSNMYGVSIAGAYRLVRNFDQVSPENDTRLIGAETAGVGGYNVTDLPSDWMEGFREGVNVQTFSQLLDYTQFKIRPNSSFVTTIGGKDVPPRAYDALLETTAPVRSFYARSTAADGRLPKDSNPGTLVSPTRTFVTREEKRKPVQPELIGTPGTPAVGSRKNELKDRYVTHASDAGVVVPFYKSRGPDDVIHGFYVPNPQWHEPGTEILFRDGRLVNNGATTLAWNDGRSVVSLGGRAGVVSARISHEREQRELGQTDAYETVESYEPYEDVGVRSALSGPIFTNVTGSAFSRLDPIEIIKTPPGEMPLPRQLVVQTGAEVTDGVIEPLVIRESIDLTSIEQPFYAHGVRGSLGGMIDAYRRSMQFADGWDLGERNQAVPFFDATETFGAGHASQGEGLGSVAQWFSGSQLLNPLYTGSDGYIYQRNAPGQRLGFPGKEWIPEPRRFNGGVLPDPTRVFGGGIGLPGAFSTDFAKITPFVDYSNDREVLYTTSDVTPIIANMLIASGTYSDDSIRTHKWMATAGFEFVNDPIGIDSIVYGGLKK